MRHRITRLLLVAVLATVTACGESPYANCVVAPQPSAFIGEKLKHLGSAERSTIMKEQCAAKDRELDGGDGARAGRVRWVGCLNGPDCDEAGMF
jgi:hypothetical protein